MLPLRVARNIVPIGDLKANAGRVVSMVEDDDEPVIITRNGRPAGVMVSPAEYDRLTYRDRVRSAIAEGLAQRDRGDVIADEDLDDFFASLAPR